MERRELIIPKGFKEFLKQEIFINDSRNTLLDAQDLIPKEGNLTRTEALHLLRRIAIHPTEQELEHYTGMPVSEAVDKLLGDGQDHLPENESRLPDPSNKDNPEHLNWFGNAIQNPRTAGALSLRFELEGILKRRYRDSVDWLFLLAKNEDLINNPSREKLTYFLHTIWNMEFTYDTKFYNPPNLLIKNSQTLRKFRVGDYKEITKQMTLDGAFLLYQSLHLSDRSAPNENYARELLELFTMGIGHYSEGDIKEAARILTGWRTAPFFNSRKPNDEFNTWFEPNAHDLDSKQFMGEIFPKKNESENNEFKVRDDEVYKLIDIIFDLRAEPISKFISEKIVKFFVYANEEVLDQTLIDSVAQVLLDNNFNLRSAYSALFKSEVFYSDKYIGCQFKSPFELMVGTSRILGSELSDSDQRTYMVRMEQQLYDPPNVSGWEQYRTWVSTTTLPFRIEALNKFIDRLGNDEIVDIIQSFDNWQNPDNFLQSFYEFTLPKDFIDERKITIENEILFSGSISKSNWQSSVESGTSQLVSNFKETLRAIFNSPDFQLT